MSLAPLFSYTVKCHLFPLFLCVRISFMVHMLSDVMCVLRPVRVDQDLRELRVKRERRWSSSAGTQEEKVLKMTRR